MMTMMYSINVLIYFIHVVSAVFWVGGIAYILFVLMPAVPRVALRDRSHFMPILLRRFLVVVWSAIVFLILTGWQRAVYVWDATETGFFDAPTGHVFATKLVLAAVLVGIALLVTVRVVPRAIAHVATHEHDPADAYQCAQCATVVGGMRRVLRAALGVALAVILLGVMLRGG